MSYVPIFHLTVPAVWIAVLLAAAVANLLMRVAVNQKMGDWYWNALAFYILVWKLSYIVFHWQYFLDMPLSLLYFNGGLYGHLLATAFVIGYLLLAQRKQTAMAEQAAAAWLLFFLAYQSILQFLEAQWVQAAFQTLLFIVAIVSIRLLRTRQDVPSGLLFGALLTMELLILSTFGPLWTWQNATLAAVVAVTIAMYRRFEQKGPSI